MEKKTLARLKDMLKSLDYVVAFADGATLENLYSDRMRASAIEREFITVGEAAKHVPRDVQEQYPHIPWRFMAGMRNFVVHEYGSINYESLLKSAQEDAPIAAAQLRELLKDFSKL